MKNKKVIDRFGAGGVVVCEVQMVEVRVGLLEGAIDMLERGLEYGRECLAAHDAGVGRVTHKNRAWAESMEKDIRGMEYVLGKLDEIV
jgi:hypothetical protein